MRVSGLRRVWSGSLDAAGAFHGAGADPGAEGGDESGSQPLLLAGIGGAVRYLLFVLCKLSLYNQPTNQQHLAVFPVFQVNSGQIRTHAAEKAALKNIKRSRCLRFSRVPSADWSHSDTQTHIQHAANNAAQTFVAPEDRSAAAQMFRTLRMNISVFPSSAHLRSRTNRRF